MKLTNYKILPFMLAGAAFFAINGCDGTPGISSDEPLVGGETALPVEPGVTSFNQTVPAEDGDDPVFPGQANHWDLDDDGSISDGSDDQFDGAMELSVNGTSFPSDQTYADLTYYAPVFTSADGAKTVALTDSNDFWPLAGNYSVLLNSGSLSQISQDIDLSTAAGAITLSFQYRADPYSYTIDGRDYYFSVSIEGNSGTTEIFNLTNMSSEGPETQNIDISAYAGQNVKLIFAYTSVMERPAYIDDISIMDEGSTEFVANGDFEGGTLASWTANEPQEAQNVTFGTRNVEGVNVTRSFYTKPNSLWGRYVDVFENNTSTSVDINVSYYTDLGSDDYGIIYDTPDTGNKAITTWDGENDDRDIGFVYGNASLVEYTSDIGLDDGDGDDNIYFYYNNITIPANSKVAIVNFVIMNGKDTADTAIDITAKATEIDAEAKAIVDGMAANTAEYFEGMTAEQNSSIINF